MYEKTINGSIPIHLLSNVPNDEGGKNVIKNIRKYLNTDRYKIRVRGRGSRKEHGDASYIPLKYAERFSIYVDQEIMDYNNPHYLSDEQWKAERKIEELTAVLSDSKSIADERYRFYSIHDGIKSATDTALFLMNNTNDADIWGGYKIVKEKDNYVLYIAKGR
tara:strand:+ start:55 stop:543 length:489 start_codon:yes stop_codon:yes gene_type:complete